MRRLARPLLVSVGLGIALYAGAMVYTDALVVADTTIRLGVSGWALLLSLSLLNYLIRFARWHWYLHLFGKQIHWNQNLAYYVTGFAFTTTPGKAGEVIRSLYLNRHGIPWSQSLAALFVERLLDLAAIAILAIAAAWSFTSTRWPVAIALIGVLAALALLHHPRLDSLLARLTSQRNWPKFTRGITHLRALLHDSAQLLQPKPRHLGLLLGLIAWGAEGIGFFVILHALDVPISLGLAIGIYAAGILAGALSFIPGGLGSTEAVMVLLLSLTGVETPTALAATLLCRLATLWFAVVLGLAALGWLELTGTRRHLHGDANA